MSQLIRLTSDPAQRVSLSTRTMHFYDLIRVENRDVPYRRRVLQVGDRTPLRVRVLALVHSVGVSWMTSNYPTLTMVTSTLPNACAA